MQKNLAWRKMKGSNLKGAQVATEGLAKMRVKPIPNWEEILRLRVAQKLTQVELAERAGISERMVQNAESELRKWRMKVALKSLSAIATALGCSVEAISEPECAPVQDVSTPAIEAELPPDLVPETAPEEDEAPAFEEVPVDGLEEVAESPLEPVAELDSAEGQQPVSDNRPSDPQHESVDGINFNAVEENVGRQKGKRWGKQHKILALSAAVLLIGGVTIWLAAGHFSQPIDLGRDYPQSATLRGNIDDIRQVEFTTGVLVHDPNNTKALHTRALAYTGLNEYAKALADFNRIIELGRTNPDDAFVLWSLCGKGSVLKAMGRLKEAVASLDEALEHKKKFSDKSASEVVLRTQKFDLVLSDIYEQRSEAYQWMGHYSGEKDNGREYYVRALSDISQAIHFYGEPPTSPLPAPESSEIAPFFLSISLIMRHTHGPQYIQLLEKRAELYRLLGMLSEAIQDQQRAFELREEYQKVDRLRSQLSQFKVEAEAEPEPIPEPLPPRPGEK